ncbi:hypothetical protein [Sphingomonas xanthus]|uniref:Uncharacterized protein n=1 Tax=Sphingomonas xanthus TaxID=2594473 RepID=A0A516IQI3_9SPHN|nr:hypothetical protein [Sphingomonas xanthus]QDP19163.1 hypothetical protein FMM02_03805 [Sphingomonas xanthus]
MSARGFGSVIWAGTLAGAALGFYLVSLSVASERAELEDVETRIALAQRDIRLLQTEIGTRGRLAQLERWNVKFIRLSAPSADQFVDGGFQLATLVTPERKPTIDAPVVLASAPIAEQPAEPRLTGDDGPAATRQPASRPVADMVHLASYRSASKPVGRSVEPGARATVQGKESLSGRPATKPAKSAMADPLAPLPVAKPKAKGSAAVTANPTAPTRNSKDSDTD